MVRFSGSFSSSSLCPKDQSSALLKFKSTFSIDSWASISCADEGITTYPKTDSWKEGTDCCKWDGIKCQNGTGNVIGLDLSCSWLRGPIQPNSSLFHLSHLQSLNLAYNNLQQSHILPEFASLVSLTHLNLSFCNLDSQDPIKLSNLSRLVSLDLGFNNPLTLENSVWHILLQNLTELRELVLDRVDMSYIAPSSFMNLSSSLTILSLEQCSLKLPDSIGNLKSLRYLDITSCKFNGSIPVSIANLTGMRYLSLNTTNFTGQIPDSFSNVCQLSLLFLGENHLTGPVPDIFCSIFEMMNLTQLDLSSNNFSGVLELNMFSKLQILTKLTLSSNSQLSTSNSITPNYPLPLLSEFYMSSCNISDFPPFLRALKNLTVSDISDNEIQGNAPNWLFDVEKYSWVRLNLSQNKLTSIKQLPWKSLHSVDLNSNLLQGSLFGPSSPDSISFFSVSSNRLTGDIPSSICNMSSLNVLDLSNNNFTGRDAV
nr:receptor-like protein 6 [Ziziphus jujuba var. spinosa]